MHVVVVGCGRVGSELSGFLESNGHTVAVVDKRKLAFQRLAKDFTGYRVVGFGFDRDTLIEAGIKDAGALAAVTSGDNTNIMSARVARETFGVDRVVARIYDPRRAAIYERLGIPTVATVSWTTDQVFKRLIAGTPEAEWTDSSGKFSLVEREITQAWIGKPVDELPEVGKFNLAMVTRLGISQLPEPGLVGQVGDIFHLLVEADAIKALENKLANPQDHY